MAYGPAVSHFDEPKADTSSWKTTSRQALRVAIQWPPNEDMRSLVVTSGAWTWLLLLCTRLCISPLWHDKARGSLARGVDHEAALENAGLNKHRTHLCDAWSGEADQTAWRQPRPVDTRQSYVMREVKKKIFLSLLNPLDLLNFWPRPTWPVHLTFVNVYIPFNCVLPHDRAIRGLRSRYSVHLSVRPPVCLSHACFVTSK